MPVNDELYAAAQAAVEEFAAKATSDPDFPRTLFKEAWKVCGYKDGQPTEEYRHRLSYSTFRLFSNNIEEGPHGPATQVLADVVMKLRGCPPEDAIRIAYCILRRTVYLFAATNTGLAERLEETYPPFEADVLAPKGKEIARVKAPLFMMEIESNKLELTDGLTIKKCGDLDFRELQDSAGYTPAEFRDRLAGSAAYLVTADVLINAEGPFGSQGCVWPFEQLHVFAKLFRASGFYMSRCAIHSPSTRRYGGTLSHPPFFPMQESIVPFLPGPGLKLSKVEEDEFRAKHQMFTRCFPEPPMPLYLRRFAKGCSGTDHEDRILDLMIALEALVLRMDAPTELSHRFSMRVAWLLGKTVQARKDVQKQAKDLYELRSKIAHGNPPKLTLPELKARADQLEALARTLIWSEVEAIATTGSGVEWANLVFGVAPEVQAANQQAKTFP